jgi:hypothetical protein
MNYSAPVPLTDWERGRWVSVSKCAAKKGSAISKRCFLGRLPAGLGDGGGSVLINSITVGLLAS